VSGMATILIATQDPASAAAAAYGLDAAAVYTRMSNL
jgi:hypothetical protein